MQTALKWQKALNANSSLTKANIARENGISRARVTQIMNLLRLPEQVISHISTLETPQDLYPFSESNTNSASNM